MAKEIPETAAIMKLVEAWESLPNDREITHAMVDEWLRKKLQPQIMVLRLFIPEARRSKETKAAIRRLTNERTS